MPVELLTKRQRANLSNFPENISRADLMSYFTLGEADRGVIGQLRGDHNRLGFALQISALRYLGFFPSDLLAAPLEAVHYLAGQLDIAPETLEAYGTRPKTVREHQLEVMAHLGFRRATAEDMTTLEQSLIERALEHDRPSVLIEAAGEKCRHERVVRPGITRIERLVATARAKAHDVSLKRLEPLLTKERRALLDSLLKVDPETRRTKLTWLRQHATSNSPRALLDVLEKLRQLRAWDVHQWDLSALNPNRLKMLARLGRKYSTQALRRMGPERRYPMLLAFLRQTFIDTIDEAADIFEACIAGAHRRAKQDLREHNAAIAQATQEKVQLFYRIGRLILDRSIDDQVLRAVIFRHIPPLEMAAAVDEAEQIIRPKGLDYFDFLENRFSYVRRFAPKFLEHMPLRSNRKGDPVLEGVEVLRRMNRERRRKVPPSAPAGFVRKKWRPFVFTDDSRDGQPIPEIHRRGYELCLLSQLRNRLRSGDVYLTHSRRYGDPETYLIPTDQWPKLRGEVCEQLDLTASGRTRLAERARELKQLLRHLDQLLSSHGKTGEVRIEHGQLIVPAFGAKDRPPSAQKLTKQIRDRLPELDVTSLLIEVDRWTNFTRHFTHPSGNEPKTPDLLRYLYASILARRCNMTIADMAQSARLSYDQLHWTTKWYVREEPLKAAVTQLVNVQYSQPLARLWGGGTLSSSDGQRFPVGGKVRNATALPRYFGYGRGITFYTWTSDQYSQYGTKVISATVRDATYLLDEILDNETELTILKHTSDTDGYTDLVFGLFDLLGLRFSPRIRDMGGARLYRLRDDFEHYPNLDGQLTGRVDLGRIEKGWDDLLRVAGSLKRGYVTASLLISKLQAYPRQNRLTRLLKEHGRLMKTIHVLRCLEDETYRRRIGAQLNKGEKLHDLRSWPMFGGDGKIRRKQEEAQTCQASCLNLMTNAIVVWNTIYMQAVIDQLQKEEYAIDEEDMRHLSPARFKHINRYGRYRFEVERESSRRTLRPLRDPS